MLALLLFFALTGTPYLGAPVTAPEKDGTGWKCSAMCLTSGNDDGGSCRTPLVSHHKPTEAACIQDLNEQCAKTKPPPGGCRAAPAAGR